APYLLGQAENVARRLRARGLRARTVGLKLKLAARSHGGRFPTLTRRHTLAEPTADESVLFAVARELLAHPELGSRRVRLAGLAAEWLAAQPLDAEVLIVGPTWEACDDLVRGAAARARFGTVRLTLDRLAARLAALVLAADERVPAGGLSTIAVAARAVHLLRAEGGLRYFAPVAGRPGFPAAVARTLEELRMNGVVPQALRRLGASGADLAALAER